MKKPPLFDSLDNELLDKCNNIVKVRNIPATRYYSLIIYPHYAREDIVKWLGEILGVRGLRAALSPLHDEDFFPDGSRKAPHYHLLLAGRNNIQPVLPVIISYVLNNNAVPADGVLKTDSESGYYEYLTHKNNPEKAQYNASDIVHINGYDVPKQLTADTDFWDIVDTASSVAELTHILRADKKLIKLLPLVERRFRTLKAYYGERY